MNDSAPETPPTQLPGPRDGGCLFCGDPLAAGEKDWHQACSDREQMEADLGPDREYDPREYDE